MKKQISIPVVILFLFCLSIFRIAPANAQTKESYQTEQKTWIKYGGSKNGIMSFDVSYHNPGRKKISITVYDEQHNNLFDSIYYDEDFHKKFQIPAGEANELFIRVKKR